MTETHSGSALDARPEPTDESTDEPTDESAADQTAEQLPLDVTFEILKNRRRRLVLEYVRQAEDTVTIGELAEHIAAIENDTTVQQLNAQQRKRVYIGLYQCHLPKMDDANVVSFNQSRGLVEVEPVAEDLYAYLDVSAEPADDDPSPLYYSGLVLGAAALFALAEVGNAPLVAAGVVVCFLLADIAVSLKGWLGISVSGFSPAAILDR